MNRILQQQQEKTALIEAAQAIVALATTEKRSLTAEELSTVTTKTQLAETIVNSMKVEAALAAASNIPNDRQAGQVHDNILDKPFGLEARGVENAEQKRLRLMCGFGEQLLAIRNAALRPHNVDPRLYELNKRALAAGASEAVPADGGFLVASDFSTEIMTIAHDTGMVYTRGRKLPMSEATNAIKIPGIDEQSRADGSRWGGVRMYWQNEADQLIGSKPKFRLIELVTKKLTGLFYATDELISDARMLGAIVTMAFGEEVGFKMDDSAINGDGSGKPLGIANAENKALIVIPKVTGQATATLLYDNVKAMWFRLHARSRKSAAWFVNQDVEAQMMGFSQLVGTGGSSVVSGVAAAGPNVYTPAGYAGNEYAMLFGRPVIPIEQCQTLGTQGDIILADMSQWVYVDKGDVQQATSMHVRFLTDEMTFRWIYRVDGQPIWQTPLTPFKGTNTQSPFIVLASR